MLSLAIWRIKVWFSVWRFFYNGDATGIFSGIILLWPSKGTNQRKQRKKTNVGPKENTV